MTAVVTFIAHVQLTGEPGAEGSYKEGADYLCERTLLIAKDNDASQVQQDALVAQYQQQYPNGNFWFEVYFLT